MDKKTTAIIAVILATLICGLPGLASICLSATAMLGGILPDTTVPQEDLGLLAAASAMICGLGLLCLSIPIGVGIWAWRSRNPKPAEMISEPIPEDDF